MVCEGGSKKFDDKNFQLPSPPHQSIYEHSLIIWLSNENMKNFNFPLNIDVESNIVVFINTKLTWCYPIEINNGRFKSTLNSVSFFNLHPAVWAGVIPLITVESNQHLAISFLNLHPAVSNLPPVYTSCRVKLTLGRVRWILFDTITVNICGCGPLLKLRQC